MSRRVTNSSSRLQQDYLRLKKDPVPYVTAEPLPRNLLEWHYVVRGPENSPYHGGLYHGKLIFPTEFPFKPPSIFMITPNGRFKTNTRLCLSISDFHPDTWNPAWSVATILTGLLSFMLEKSPTLGSIETTDFERQKYAQRSLEFNLKNHQFCELFPELVTEIEEELTRREKAMQANQLYANNRSSGNNSSFQSHGLQNQSPLQSALTNVVVILGFAVFAYTVKYVLKSLAPE